MPVIERGPIPRVRGYWTGMFGVACRARGGHRWRCWLAPPGTPTAKGEQAFRLCRCYRCGIERAD